MAVEHPESILDLTKLMKVLRLSDHYLGSNTRVSPCGILTPGL